MSTLFALKAPVHSLPLAPLCLPHLLAASSARWNSLNPVIPGLLQ